MPVIVRAALALWVALMATPSFVLACAGQSNMAGRATNAQVYSPAGLDAKCWTGSWVDLTDANYGASTGSFVPLLATLIGARTGSVGFVPGASSGTSITQWLPGQTLYNALKAAVIAAGGCRGWLWWQGETDEQAAMSQATYNGHLDTLANGVFADLGVPLIPCKLQDYGAGATWIAINAAIAEAWGDNSHVITGPDFSDLSTTPPQGDGSFHLVQDAVMLTVASRWDASLAAGGLYPHGGDGGGEKRGSRRSAWFM